MKINIVFSILLVTFLSLNSCKSVDAILKKAKISQLSTELDSKDPDYIKNHWCPVKNN